MRKVVSKSKSNIFICVLFIFLAGQTYASNAYITLEVKKANKIYQELHKISVDNKIMPKSYNEYANKKNKKNP